MHSFEWLTLIPSIKSGDIPIYVVHTLMVMAVLVTMIFMASGKLRSATLDIVPSRRFNLLNFFELSYEALEGVTKDVMGHQAPRFMWLVGSLAFFILFNNLLGVIPGLTQPTDNLNTTAACALVVFTLTHVYGFKEHGIAYLKHFVGPSPFLAPLMIPIEIIGHLARPLSLSLRLFGNMFGDHMVLAVFIYMMSNLTKLLLTSSPFLWVFLPIAPIVPIVVYVLGMFVAIVQTYVFILLTMSYIAGAVDHAH